MKGAKAGKHITPRNSIPSIEGSTSSSKKSPPSRGRSPLHSSSVKIGSALVKPNNSFNVGGHYIYESLQGRVSSAMYPDS